MKTANDWLVSSFVADGAGWRGAIYAIHPGRGPELLLECVHDHDTMRAATRCAERELAFARRVIAIADERRPS